MNVQQDNFFRDSLYQAVYQEFVGPIDEQSEEIMEWNKPNKAYSAGVLYPMGTEFKEFEEPESEEMSEPRTSEEIDEDSSTTFIFKTSRLNNVSDEDEPIVLSNSDYQSAISLTFAVSLNAKLKIEAKAASYEKILCNGHVAYKRVPIVSRIDVPMIPKLDSPFKVKIEDTNLELMLVSRYCGSNDTIVLTAALRNTIKSNNPKSASYSECYYQVGFTLSCDCGFEPIPVLTHTRAHSSDEELSKQLIYRNIQNFAIGHGCATDWENSKPVHWIKTEIIPTSESTPIKTSIQEIPREYFDMYRYSISNFWKETSLELKTLCDCYQGWINDLTEKAKCLPKEHKEAANNNIRQCQLCLNRMRDGLNILCVNDNAKEAFTLANEAMLSQYLHYSVVSNECDTVRNPKIGLRNWRPFQIAFLLMNIRSMTDSSSEEHGLLDLIWFPTGGGKTEAYLGLTAFTLLLERINKQPTKCTSVIMRYTLRLLSAQQFDRAASLICSLEMLRRRNPERLGEKTFSIGLWAGSAASPNTWEQALHIKDDLRRGKQSAGVIPVTRCPWCGEEMGFEGAGYVEDRCGKQKVLRFVCPNSNCDFGTKRNPLPLKVVDEDIYADPPSLLLGTVDKFAMIPYRPESYVIFGIDKNGTHVSAPKLIIQDELHLISGPLGSMVSHYETLVSDLCSCAFDGIDVFPKIVASTATVSRAKEQCHELFACGKENVFQFPPSGIDYDDSFFSASDLGKPGRRYVGLYIPNLSYATASIRLYSRLLWTPATWDLENDEDRDPYWTVVGYYGTTRELGQAATWADSDIKERLFEYWRTAKKKKTRYLNKFTELTGRIDAPEVRKGLDSLKVSYPDRGTIDLCLATNMISVGLDVPRLGMMVIAGQPKETSEYIQASSRVGRGEAKGIVFVMYGTQRPRDRSHYENFKNYHESFYQHVEPSSITAFCPQVRDRAMPGTLIGMYRAYNREDSCINKPDEKSISIIKDKILNRIELIDPEEIDDTSEQIDDIVDHWWSYDYERWQELNTDREKMGEQIPLIHPRGADVPDNWGDAGFELPTSMRSVDQECKVSVIGRYGLFDDGEEE